MRHLSRNRAAWLVVLGAAALVLGLAGGTVAWVGEVGRIREAVGAAGPLGPVAFVLLQTIQVVVAPVPGQALAFASGYLFGAVPGTLLSLLGAAMGSYVVFRLSRRYGRGYVERVLGPDATARFDAVAERGGLPVLFVVFLLPGLPDDAVCFVGGLTDLRIRDLLAVSIAGRLPGYFLLNVAGAGVATNRYLESLLLLGAVLALSAVAYVWRGPILERAAGYWRQGRT